MTRNTMARLPAVLLAILLAAAAVAAKEVRVELLIRPALDLDGTERVYLGPFLVEPTLEGSQRPGVDIAREFEGFMRSELRRETRLEVVPQQERLAPPTNNPLQLQEMSSFWQEVGRSTGADIIVSGSLQVQVHDRAGYRTEEYVSPQDGKTYFRQVLVEATGFSYDILLTVFDAHTGELLHSEHVTDFKPQPKRRLNQFMDLFDDLYNFDNRVLGVFAPRRVEAKRHIFR